MLKCILLIFIVLISACGSGRSSITEIKNHEPKDTVSVIKNEFKDDNDVLEKKLVGTIKNEKLYDFDLFWSLLSLETDFLKELTFSGQVKLFSFHRHFNKCDTKTFSTFSKLAINYEGGIEVLSNEKLRPCSVGINEKVVDDALDKLFVNYNNTKSSSDLKKFIDFILSEMKYGKNKSWLDKINKLNKKEWSQAADELLGFYQGENLQNLISAHIQVNGYVPFGKPLANKLIKDSVELKLLKKQLGFVATLDFLTYSSDYDFGSLSVDESQSVLDNLLEMYLNEDLSNNGLMDNLHTSWNQMIQLRKFQSRIQSIHALDKELQMSWLSQLHQRVEKLLFKSEYDANLFLSQLNTTEVDLYWFKLRVFQKFNSANMSGNYFMSLREDYIKFNEDVSLPVSFINILLKARLDLRILSDQLTQNKYKEKYCQIVGNEFARIEELNTVINKITTPGCLTARKITIENEEFNGELISLKENGIKIPDGVNPNLVRADVNLTFNNLKMSDDSALFLPATDLHIISKGSSLDLSFISLSADQKISDKIVLNTPKTHDGVVIPVPLVLHNMSNKKSISFVVPLGIVYQEPFDGQIWADELTNEYPLINGVHAGSFSIEGPEDTNYIAPIITAYGGFGQDWERLKVKGGTPSEFNFFPFKYVDFSGWFADFYDTPGRSHVNLKGSEVQEDPFAISYFSDLEKLMKLYSKSKDQNVYFPKDFLVQASEDTFSSYTDICKNFNRQNDIDVEFGTANLHFTEECLLDIANKAWSELLNAYESIAKNSKTDDITLPSVGPAGTVKTIQNVPVGLLENYSIDGDDGELLLEFNQRKTRDENEIYIDEGR